MNVSIYYQCCMAVYMAVCISVWLYIDVVEISSSEEDEDSDLIMMPSDTELDEDDAVADDDDDDDDDGDVQNSGSHVNDALNKRDAMGGVLVNVGHPATETDIFLAPQLAAVVKPHQVLNYYNIFII